MIRLAVSGAENWLAEVARRVRGAELLPWKRDTAADSLKVCDAVVMLDGASASEQVRQCLAAGKQVLISAAAVVSGDVLGALLAEVTTVGGQLAIVNPDRFLPSRQLVHQEIAANKLGEPGLVRVLRWEAFTATAATATSLPSALLCDLDIARWLIGKSPSLVYAMEHEQKSETQASRGKFIQVHLGFPTGAMALIDYSSRLPAGEGYQSLHVIGSAGAAYGDDQQNMQLLYHGGQPRGMKAPETIRQMTALLQDFIDGLALKRDFSLAHSSWQGVLTIAAAVLQSLQSRQAVSLEGR